MAQIVIQVPDAEVPRILAAFEARRPTTVGEPVGAFTAADVKQALIRYIKDVVKNHEANQARIAAESSVTEVTPS